MKIGRFIDRAQTGSALRATHRMTQNLLASLLGAIFLCARDFKIQYANTLAHHYFRRRGSVLVREAAVRNASRSVRPRRNN